MWGTYTIEKYVEYHMQRNKAYMDKHIQKQKEQGMGFYTKDSYCVTVGHNEEAVKRYIRNQLQEDRLSDQMSMKEFIDPFTGDKVK